MKKAGILLILFSLVVGMDVCPLQATPAPSKSVSVRASVPNSSAEIDITILRFTDGNPDNDPWTSSAQVSSMDFGTLTHTLTDGTDAALWYAQAAFCVVIYAQGFGSRYEIKSTCNGLVSGANRLPQGSFGLTPVYSDQDRYSGGSAQGARPTGSELGSAGPAVVTNKLIYRSESSPSTPRIIQAYYGLPPYRSGGANPFTGFQPIPLNQPAAPADNPYQGTVTITITGI